MTHKEIRIVCWACTIFGWLFLIFARAPEIALVFFFVSLGGLIWGTIRKKWGKK